MTTKTSPSILRKTVAVLTIVFAAYGTSATAQNQMAARYVCYEVKPEHQKEFRKALSEYVRQAISDKSNIMAEAYHEEDKPSVHWVIERWTSKKELENFGKNSQSKAVANLAKKALLVPAEAIYVIDLEPISKQQWRRTVKANESQLTIMLFVDSKPGTQQNFRDVYHVAMPQFRSEPGVVTYQLSEFEGDDSRFVTYEKFRNEAAFQYHLKFPPIQPVIDYLNGSIKNPPFQDGVHRLVELAPLIREN